MLVRDVWMLRFLISQVRPIRAEVCQRLLRSRVTTSLRVKDVPNSEAQIWDVMRLLIQELFLPEMLL